MNYHISFEKPTTHFLHFKVTINALEPNLLIQLPTWRPGRYQIQNFAKRIKNIQAFDTHGKSLAITKLDKSSWQLKNEPGSITISYEYFAFEMDAGNTWLDDEQLYVNFINCCIYDPSQMDTPCEIKLDLPKDYEIACGLEWIGENTLQAPNYFQLVDSPLIASNILRRITYSVADTKFNIWIQGDLPKTDDAVIEDFAKFSALQIQVMGEFPCSEYHFLFQCLPYKHYHGVEHWNSTVITIGPSKELSERKLYKEFLGVSSHELFHTWNVIRLRPIEMTPYDFQSENYHQTGFVTEGVTTYYGDLFLARSGVFSFDEYLGDLNKLLKRHYDNEGRKGYSVAESSFDLWLDGYEKGIPGRKVSIYNEGALAALILDLKIRLKFDNRKSLDDVMRLMWTSHGKGLTGYSYGDYQIAATSVFEAPLEEYFTNIISGNQPYETYLADLFPKFGLTFSLNQSEKVEERNFGIRLNKEMIIDIATNAPAYSMLSIGDKIESINGIAFKEEALISESLALQINRFGRQLKVELSAKPNNYFAVYQVIKNESSDPKSLQRLSRWLGDCIA